PGRAGKRGQPAQRCSDCSEAQDDGRRSCAHSPGNGPRALGVSPSGGARYAAAVDEVASIPTAALRRARTGWRYALPLDTALATPRVRARVGGQKTPGCGWAAVVVTCVGGPAGSGASAASRGAVCAAGRSLVATGLP